MFSNITEIYLNRLKLKNFRAHGSSEIIFSTKNNIILGENGAGKSSILMGLIYGLFGSDGLNTYEKSGRKVNLVKRGESELLVELELNLVTPNDVKTILITRRLNRIEGKELADIKVIKNGVFRTYATGIEKVKTIIFKEIFNVDERNTNIIELIYCRQGELGEFIKKLPTMENARFIDKVLEIHKITEIIDLLNSKLNESKLKYESKTKTLTEIENILKEFEKELKEKNINTENKEEIEEIINKKKRLDTEIKKLMEFLAKFKEFEGKINTELLSKKTTLEIEYKNILEQINEYEERLKKIKEEIEEIRKNIPYGDFIESNEISFEDAIKNYSKEKEEEIKREINIIDSDLKLLNNIDLEKIKEINDMKKRLDELKNEKQSIITKINELKKLLDLLKKGELKKCPICGSDISNNYIEIKSKKEKELQDLMAKLNSIKSRINRLEDNISLIEKSYSIISSISNKYNTNMENTKDFLVKKIETLKKELNKLLTFKGVIVKFYKNQISKKEEDIEEIETTIKDLISKKTNIYSELKRITEIEDYVNKYNELKKEVSNYFKKSVNSSKDIESLLIIKEDELNKLPDINEDYVNKYFSVLEKCEKIKSELNDINKNIDLISKLIKEFEKLRREIREFFVSKITILLNDWFKKLYKYNDILSLEFVLHEPQRKTTEQMIYSINIKFVDGSKKDIREAGLSGGQLTALDIAFRFSLLNLVLPRVRFILFDEPTNSLDENVKSNLIETLKNISNLQIIVATHDELFKNAANKIIFVNRSGKEGSCIGIQDNL